MDAHSIKTVYSLLVIFQHWPGSKRSRAARPREGKVRCTWSTTRLFTDILRQYFKMYIKCCFDMFHTPLSWPGGQCCCENSHSENCERRFKLRNCNMLRFNLMAYLISCGGTWYYGTTHPVYRWFASCIVMNVSWQSWNGSKATADATDWDSGTDCYAHFAVFPTSTPVKVFVHSDFR
jgi:hypothetical protein